MGQQFFRKIFKVKKMIKAGVVGISGYSGYEVLNILLHHPAVRVRYVSANSTEGAVGDLHPQLREKTDLICGKFDYKKAISACDVIFLAVPHAISMGVVPHFLKAGRAVIDLSGDYRLKSPTLYKKWYGADHLDGGRLGKIVYGLPEIYRAKIKKARLIANPGCYPTAAILALAPLLSSYSQFARSIIIDAKSGVSGAGKKTNAALMFCEVSDNFKAYKVTAHQHTPEIDQHLSKISGKNIAVTFVPHLLPVNRGILETIYVNLAKKISVADIHSVYKKFYKTEPFVRVLAEGQQTELRNVVGTNTCEISLAMREDANVLVVTVSIDNLLKGAAGQAVQNMNIMFGFPEEQGLR